MVPLTLLFGAALGWGIARLGPAHAGKVIGWVGMALFAAYGAGAPVGSWVHARFGFGGVALATVLVPLLALGIALAIRAEPPTQAAGGRPAFHKIVGLVKLPGLALTLSSFGYAAINAFITLLWVERGWGSAALAFTSLGAGFIVSRLLLGHLPGIEMPHDFFPQPGDLFWTPADWAWAGGLLDALLDLAHVGRFLISVSCWHRQGDTRSGRIRR